METEIIKEIKKDLEQKVDAKLLEHILSVNKKARELAKHYNVDQQAVSIAALMHDYAKQDQLTYNMIKPEDCYDGLDSEDQVWHGYIASYIAIEKYQIKDPSIIEAIKYHTTAKTNLSNVAKVVFIADKIEDLRVYPNVDNLRKYENDLDTHFKKVFNNSINYLVNKGIKVDKLSDELYNQLNKE